MNNSRTQSPGIDLSHKSPTPPQLQVSKTLLDETPSDDNNNSKKPFISSFSYSSTPSQSKSLPPLHPPPSIPTPLPSTSTSSTSTSTISDTKESNFSSQPLQSQQPVLQQQQQQLQIGEIELSVTLYIPSPLIPYVQEIYLSYSDNENEYLMVMGRQSVNYYTIIMIIPQYVKSMNYLYVIKDTLNVLRWEDREPRHYIIPNVFIYNIYIYIVFFCYSIRYNSF